MNNWELALIKDWHLNEPMSSVKVGEIVDTGEHIRRVTDITTHQDSIVLHFSTGNPYEADADNLIDVWR